MKYIVDIDGTICTQQKSSKEYHLAKPYMERIHKVNTLFDKGHTIVYMTARGMASGTDCSEITKKQLEDWGVKYDELIMGVKPSYDVWVDDKAEWIF